MGDVFFARDILSGVIRDSNFIVLVSIFKNLVIVIKCLEKNNYY